MTTLLQGQILYLVVYNRRLTQTEVNQNADFLTQVMFARGQPIFTQSNSTTDLFLIDGDSEPNSVLAPLSWRDWFPR